MNCQQVHSLLGRFHDRELTPGDRSAVETHLEGCPGCAAELSAIAELSQFVRVSAVPEPTAGAWDKILRRLETARPSKVASVKRAWQGWQIATAAAMLMVVVSAGLLTVRYWPRSEARPDLAATPLNMLVGKAPTGQLVPAREAGRQVEFHVLVAPELPGGYVLKECRYIPCERCTRIRSEYQRGDEHVTLIQYSCAQSVCYGDRPVLLTRANGRPLRIAKCEERLAASWQNNGTAISLIAPDDICELIRITNYVDEQLAAK